MLSNCTVGETSKASEHVTTIHSDAVTNINLDGKSAKVDKEVGSNNNNNQSSENSVESNKSLNFKEFNNNHGYSKSPPQDNINSLEQNLKQTRDSSKKLSFFPGDDDSDGSSSPLNLKRPTSTKWTHDDEKHTNDNDNGHHDKANNPSCSVRIKGGDVESDHENASSTSSCSCEDHSSVADHSEENHEDLDYDEDSVTSSPERTSNSTNDLSKSSTQAKKHNLSMRELGLDSAGKIFEDSKIKAKLHSSHDEHQETEQERKDSQVQTRPRIKSVINFNHINDQDDDSIIQGEDDKSLVNGKSRKSYDCLLKYFFKDACYFQIKSINHENVQLSKSMGVWSTPVQNELKLNSAFREHRNIILIFSVQQSGGFQGFARMISESKPANRPVPWVLPERLSNRSLGGVFKVEWLCTKELPFHETQGLFNPFNGNKPVKVARDGQQVEPKIGKKLCKLFPHDNKERLLSSVATLKRQTSQRKKSAHKHDNQYHSTNRKGYQDEIHYPHAYMPHSGMNNGFGGRPSPTSHINHEYIDNLNHRAVGSRRRTLDQPNRKMHHYQQIHYPSQYGLHHHNGMMRCPMTSGHDFYHDQGYTHPPPAQQNYHLYPGPSNKWSPYPESSRYHPYHRSRR